jgi:hypothetical protein
MLTLNDGRSELWQWDTNRELTVDADCSQVHFSNKVFGRSIDVDVVDGVAIIPDILLQTDKELTAWAFVGTAENGYTKISKTFKVNKRNKPADYVFTPQDQSTLGEILDRIEDLENRPSGDVSKEDIQNAVNDYLDKNPVSFEEKDPTVPEWAKKPQKPTYTAEEVGAQPEGDYILRDELPEIPGGGIPIPETAEVGQTIVVKAVDENGKPTEWECAELPSGGERRLIKEITLTEDTYTIDVNSDSEGKPFELTELIVYGYTKGTASAGAFRINCHTNNDDRYSLLSLSSFKGLDTTQRYWMAKCEYLGEPGKWMCGYSTPDSGANVMPYGQKGSEARTHYEKIQDGNGALTKLSHIRITSNTSGNNIATGSRLRIYGR